MEFVSLGKTAHLGPHPKSVAQRQQGHAAECQLPNLYAEQQECDNNAGSVGARNDKDRQRYCGSTGCLWKICDCRTKEEERREACQGQAKEKDGPEDGGESRNSKCGHYIYIYMTGKGRERVG